MQVGIRVYQLKMYNNHRAYTHSKGVAAQDIHKIVRTFISKYTSKPFLRTASSDDGEKGEKRSHRFIPMKDVVNTQHGLIRYGTFGYGAEVEDVNTGSIAHTRTTDEADTIPLYYRLWWPDGYTYGLWAFQSYSGRSCATAVLSEVRSYYREKFPDWRLEAKKIVHDEFVEHKRRRVKRITLVKPKVSGSSVNKALRPVNSKSEVDVSLEVTARGNSSFGSLNDLKNKLSRNMVVDGVDYTRAYATVSVNGKPKKIGVIGISSNTGVIDVTEEVDFDPVTMMPTPDSISRVAKGEIKDFALKLGK